MIDEVDAREGAVPWKEMPSGLSWLVNLSRFFIAAISALVLIGLLIPAFQRPRINTRKMQCASSLRQMGLGIEGYTAQYRRFPPGTIPNEELSIERRLGWGIVLLPYIDQVGYFSERGTTESEATRFAWDDPIFADLMTDPPTMTRCPESLGRNGFIAIAGLGIDSPSLPTSHKRAGIFGDDRRVTPADIKDGTSTTMMLTESDSTTGPWFAGGRHTVRGLDPSRTPYIGPNRQFGGRHKGGANVLFADGSLRFVTDSIDAEVFEAMSTMAGGEKVSVPWDD
jgi:prepilin-type processing-associated H-X9-DG protein